MSGSTGRYAESRCLVWYEGGMVGKSCSVMNLKTLTKKGLLLFDKLVRSLEEKEVFLFQVRGSVRV